MRPLFPSINKKQIIYSKWEFQSEQGREPTTNSPGIELGPSSSLLVGGECSHHYAIPAPSNKGFNLLLWVFESLRKAPRQHITMCYTETQLVCVEKFGSIEIFLNHCVSLRQFPVISEKSLQTLC